VFLGVLIASAPVTRGPTFERVHALKQGEGVFAYSRISPDGRYLAYASEAAKPRRRREVDRTVTVVDLRERRVVFREAGIDGYFSTDGERMIWLSYAGREPTVSIRNTRTGAVTRNVAPVPLGDYYSWGTRDGRDIVLTVGNNYYYLDRNKAVLPASRVPSCARIGVGERPLISKDGRRISTFVRGTVVVRNLSDCQYVFDTGIQGAKTDFSWDGRYLAMHVPRTNGRGYDIEVVDLEQLTVRTVTASLPGSSLFPSWTRDGRLSFRYDGEDYRGFIMASDVLGAAERPLPRRRQSLPSTRGWGAVFPETPTPAEHLVVVMVWGTWSAHIPDALTDLQRARADFSARGMNVRVLMATEPASWEADVARTLARQRLQVPRISLAPERLTLTEAHNQNPATLLFRDGELLDRRLGAQSFEELRTWIEAAVQADSGRHR
jgi:hypothetical protein